MKFKLLLVAAAFAGTASVPPAVLGQAQPAPAARSEAKLRQMGAEVLFWTQEQRDANFPAMEKLFPGHKYTLDSHPATQYRARHLSEATR